MNNSSKELKMSHLLVGIMDRMVLLINVFFNAFGLMSDILQRCSLTISIVGTASCIE